MSPPNAFVATQLRQLIYYHLDNDLLDNALFLAGRLHGLEPRNGDTAHLLALCNLRSGRLKAAYDYSKDHGLRGKHLGCAYIFAQACLRLGRCEEGIQALNSDRARSLWGGRSSWNKHSDCSRRQLPDAAAVNCLLGKLYRSQDNDGTTGKAADCFVEALRLNPFMWDAFTELCDHIGADLQPANIFKMTPEMAALLSSGATLNGRISESPPLPPVQVTSTSQSSLFTPTNDPFNSSRTAVDPGLNLGGSNLLSRLNGRMNIANGNSSQWDSPIGSGNNDIVMEEAGPTVNRHVPNADPPQAPLRKKPTSFNSDSLVEAPRMRSMLTRSKIKSSSESHDIPEASRSIPTLTTHKRTNSGHIQQPHIPPPHAHTNGEAAPMPQPRKSARLIDRVVGVRPGSSRLAAAPAREVESKEKRNVRNAKAPSMKSRPATTVGREVSGNREMRSVVDREAKEVRPTSGASGAINGVPKAPAVAPYDSSREQEALNWLFDLFTKLGNGYSRMSRLYDCQAALESYASIPASQRDTPWVLARIGRAHYERNAYQEAVEVFAKLRKIAPSRTEDMEIYSTVLWHLKATTELAFLSHELVEADRLSPQAWCALGNSFSLAREHDQAIKCFKRATQLDSKFAYAWTLQGHEHIANEEFDKAMLCYRAAVASDNRHYNGWYGLGRCYERLGKYEVAEKHYKFASQINPRNAVLVVCVGVIKEKLKQPQHALLHYNHACSLDPNSALARFKMARALMSVGRAKEALKELEVLKDIAPDEANVHFMLGRLYKITKDKPSAIRHLTIAMNLDPKAQQYIKEQMDSLDESEGEGFDDFDDND